MTTQTIIKPQTAAGSGRFISNQFDSVVVHADGLAGAEEVDIYLLGGVTRTPYTVGGLPVKLTVSQPNATLPPGPGYELEKDATASACGVYASVYADPC